MSTEPAWWNTSPSTRLPSRSLLNRSPPSTLRERPTMADIRALPVPEGLEGERVDAALARLFGLSRTKAADLATAGSVTIDQRLVGKSDRVHGGAWLEVELPDPRSTPGLAVVADPIPGMAIIHDDDDLVVVDKPVGVAAHPS